MNFSVGRWPAILARNLTSAAAATHGETCTSSFADSAYNLAWNAFFTAQNAGPPMIAVRPKKSLTLRDSADGNGADTNP